MFTPEQTVTGPRIEKEKRTFQFQRCYPMSKLQRRNYLEWYLFRVQHILWSSCYSNTFEWSRRNPRLTYTHLNPTHKGLGAATVEKDTCQGVEYLKKVTTVENKIKYPRIATFYVLPTLALRNGGVCDTCKEDKSLDHRRFVQHRLICY